MGFQIGAIPREFEEIARAKEAGVERLLAADIIGHRTVRDAQTPQIFYVDQVIAGSRIRPHYHGVDQFQLIVRGDGHLGKRFVEIGAFHYADAGQPYGPIVAGENGLAYLTIRNRHDPGVSWMPESRHRRTQKPRRPQFISWVDPNAPCNDVVIEPHDDGLKVARFHAPPDRRRKISADEASDGLVVVVLDGDLVHNLQRFPQWSCLSLAAGTSANVQAASNGADLLAFQFPTKTSE